MELSKVYNNRFSEGERARKQQIWKILCSSFFQKYVPPDSTLLDIGAGYCEFINNIKCKRKVAVDLNEDTALSAAPDVSVHKASSSDMPFLKCGSIDVVFMSNFLEHLKCKEDVMMTLLEAHRVLRAGGRILLLQPNIRFIGGEYWDFFDHAVPLSDRSLSEALEIAGFEVVEVIPRVLPYSTKSSLPQHPFLVRAYLAMPMLWKIFGKQAFVYGRKK